MSGRLQRGLKQIWCTCTNLRQIRSCKPDLGIPRAFCAGCHTRYRAFEVWHPDAAGRPGRYVAQACSHSVFEEPCVELAASCFAIVASPGSSVAGMCSLVRVECTKELLHKDPEVHRSPNSGAAPEGPAGFDVMSLMLTHACRSNPAVDSR